MKKFDNYYPHATSHFLGLNVHDVGDYDRRWSRHGFDSRARHLYS